MVTAKACMQAGRQAGRGLYFVTATKMQVKSKSQGNLLHSSGSDPGSLQQMLVRMQTLSPTDLHVLICRAQFIESVHSRKISLCPLCRRVN
jgi:hypothetical protein